MDRPRKHETLALRGEEVSYFFEKSTDLDCSRMVWVVKMSVTSTANREVAGSSPVGSKDL